MMIHTHQSAPTPCIAANGIRLDAPATERVVILFNKASVRDALLLGHGNEITEMPQRHGGPYLWSMTFNLQSLSCRRLRHPDSRRQLLRQPAAIPGRTGP
jgi:hypothetical protein